MSAKKISKTQSKFLESRGMTIQQVADVINACNADYRSINHIAAALESNPRTIQRFISAFMPDFILSYKAASSKNYAWLIDGSVKTTAIHVQKLRETTDLTMSGLAKSLGAPINELHNLIYSQASRRYIESPEAPMAEEERKIREANRLFSMCAIGTNPKALAQLERSLS